MVFGLCLAALTEPRLEDSGSQSFSLRMGFPKGCSDDQVSCGPVHLSQGGERSVVVELFHLFDGSRGIVGPTVQDCAVL